MLKIICGIFIAGLIIQGVDLLIEEIKNNYKLLAFADSILLLILIIIGIALIAF